MISMIIRLLSCRKPVLQSSITTGPEDCPTFLTINRLLSCRANTTSKVVRRCIVNSCILNHSSGCLQGHSHSPPAGSCRRLSPPVYWAQCGQAPTVSALRPLTVSPIPEQLRRSPKGCLEHLRRWGLSQCRTKLTTAETRPTQSSLSWRLALAPAAPTFESSLPSPPSPRLLSPCQAWSTLPIFFSLNSPSSGSLKYPLTL